MIQFFEFLADISNFIWDWPMSVVLVGAGILISIMFGFGYQRRVIFHFKNSAGRIFKESDGKGSISGFGAACVAMANTIGIGNIGGVATAIAAGGPGAVFWMWFSAFFGISTKAAEAILGQRYRERYKESIDEYVCDRSFVMKNSMGWKTGGMILAAFCFTFGPWTNLVQSEAFTASLDEAFGLNTTLTLVILCATVFITIFGGLHRISSAVERLVPIMAIAYILAGIAFLVANASQVPGALYTIVYHAFHPTAAVGGFAGAAVRDTIRYGIARGLYSNDAGTGYGMVAHASARVDHPVRQSSWAWFEVVVDTFVICTMTALIIIVSGAYINHPGVTSGRLTTVAFADSFGYGGAVYLSLAITVFVWTTIVGMYYSCEKAINYFFGDTKLNSIARRIYMVYFLVPVFLFSDLEAELLWIVTDLITASYVIITLLLVFLNRKELRRLYNDFWQRFIPAKKRGENPPIVSYPLDD